MTEKERLARLVADENGKKQYKAGPSEQDVEWCKSCRYWKGTCDYLLMTGFRRGCTPGYGCERRDE